MGIEPTLSAWEAEVLPLNYIRNILLCQMCIRDSSYAVNDDDLKISTVIMGNKEIYNHFVYERGFLGFPKDYAKSTHKQTAFVIYICLLYTSRCV